MKSGEKCEKNQIPSHLEKSFFSFEFFYIIFHAFYTDVTCLNGYGQTYIRCRSKPLIYLKSGEKCKKNWTPSHTEKSFLSFAIILFHYSCILRDVFKWVWTDCRSKPLIFLNQEKNVKKTRPMHILRNYFLVLQFFLQFFMHSTLK